MKLRINETILAKIIGKQWVIIPNISQHAIPKTNITYINSEISFVFLVLIILSVCGRNATVVLAAAIYPMS